MADDKVTNRDLIKLRRSVALRELALGSSYPQTHTGITLHHKRADGADRLHGTGPHATTVASPVAEPPRGRVRDDPDPPVSVAKPWKKPWDK